MSARRTLWQEKFLESVRYNFLIQVLVPTRAYVQLNQLFTDKEELFQDVIINGNCIWNDCELMEFKTPGRLREVRTRVCILYFKGAHSGDW